MVLAASMTMSGTNIEPSPTNNNNNHTHQQNLSKKSFLGSNTSIGRGNRDGNIPVRAVSPRVRWVEEKPSNEQYDSQQITTSQQNVSSFRFNWYPFTNILKLKYTSILSSHFLHNS